MIDISKPISDTRASLAATRATIAERILRSLMGGDGCARKTRIGVRVDRLVRRIATSTTRDRLGNAVGYTFADGSDLERHGSGWDTPEGWAENA